MSEPFDLFFTLFCIIHLWIIAAVLLFNKSAPISNRLLAFFLISFSFIHIQHAALQTGYLGLFPYFDPICGIVICLAFPVFLFYVRSLTGPFKFSDRKNLQHLIITIPAILNLVYLLLFKREQDLKVYYYREDQHFSLVNALLLGGMTILLLFYLLLSLQTIKNYSVNLKRNFSNIEKLKIDWLHQLIGFLLALVLIIAPLLIIAGYPEWNRIGMGLFTSSMFMTMMVKTFRHSTITMEEINDSAKTPPIQISQENEELLFNRLKDFIQNDKPYLNPHLNLNQLAKEVDIQPYLLSYLINKKYNQTFFDLINGLRVEEAKTLLLDSSKAHFTLEALAGECGFGSKSTFNKSFKKITRQTPTQYRKHQVSVANPTLA